MKKSTKIMIGVLITLAIIIIGARIITPEDTWICSDGEWIKHGNPSSEMPTTICE